MRVDEAFEAALLAAFQGQVLRDEYGSHPTTGAEQLIVLDSVAIEDINGGRYLVCRFHDQRRPALHYGYRYDLSSPDTGWAPEQLASMLAVEIDEVIEAADMGLPLAGPSRGTIWLWE